MKIAMVSEDTGGEVSELSAALTGRGHQVTVYTRRDDPGPPDRVQTAEGYTVVHVPAGPAAWLSEDQVLS